MTSEKCAVVYVNSSESDLRRKACARWRQCLTGLVVLTSLSTAVICLGVCMFTLQAVSDLESRLGHAESIVAQERDQLTTLQAQAVSMKLQAPHVREGHGRRRRRRNSRHGHTPTFVHLVGTNTTSDAALFTGGKFQWNLFHPDDAPLPGLGLEPNNNPVTIRIDVNGIFDVYSQIGIEGRNDNTGNNHVACGHKTVLIRGDQTRTLMESRVTQHNLNFLRRFQTEQNDFLGRIITGDETWVYSWDPETKRQSAEWRNFDEPRPEKVRRKQGALKVMHMISFDMNGVILRWPVPIGTTINAQYYKKVLQDKLRPAIRKKRPGLLESGILFHHDNAPVHTARAVTDVLAGYKWELLEHPRYSPDLAPCDFHLFPKMKEHLRGQRFETEEDIIQATKVAIKNLDKCSYVTAFKDWLQRIEKCANNGGCYVE
ncbi:hypothetical protein RRG08_059677 [Elysia crispata]|uniref:Transposase n=1 Tax=Elysia crispata TaxID=231223 RepID=A0AAE1B692_9GAST|nr:hypothetical protein RRG08_059677 [Elysia crispata]